MQDLLCTLSSELPTLDMQHEITATNILHDEVYTGLCLETCVKVGQEGMTLPVRNKEDPLFGPHALNFVILDDELLLENLNGIKSPRPLGFGKHDLSEITLAQHSQEIEVVETNALASSRIGSQWKGLAGGCDLSRGRG